MVWYITQPPKELMAGASKRRQRAVLNVLLEPSIEATNQQTFVAGLYVRLLEIFTVNSTLSLCP
ncbi:MAG: hypothetical protein LBF72_03065 [Holosporales bacterium]|nr:hypothetical protein [Holosporales bacterium]